MSRDFSYIKDLKKDLDICKLGFRVLDSWTVTASNGRQHLELIIGDAKGDRVHVVTRYADFEYLKSFIEENHTYVLHNCLVFDNDVAFKPVDYPFKVVFGAGTKVTKNDNLTDIPSHEFRFKSFKEIEEGKFKTDVLYEIIGLIHEIRKVTVIGSGKKPCTNIVLKDESGKLVDVTLWDRYSLDLSKYFAERKDTGPVVLILTHAQCKFADNGKPNLCNNWSGSKLLINFKHHVVETFRASFRTEGHALSQSLCQGSSSSKRFKDDEFSNLSNVRPISEFRDLVQETYCITVGRIFKFNPNQFGWYYESCTKCAKAAKLNGASYKCSCGEEYLVPLTRYKVVVQVVYDGNRADFLFWDKECLQILGVTADALRKSMQEVGEDDPKIYPKHLDKLLGLELVMRVKYQPYYRQASVLSFSRDSVVIEKIKSHIHPDEIQPEVQEVDESIVSNNATGSSQSEKLSDSTECSKAVYVRTNVVCNDLTQSVKLEKMGSYAKCSNSVPISMNIVCDNPIQSIKVEKMVSSAECLKSDCPSMVGSCAVANCSSAEECEGHVASDDRDPTQISYIKLSKRMKKE